MYKYIPGHFLFLWMEIILLIINVISLMQKTEVMYNRATVITDLRYLSYPVIFVLLIFSLLMAGCSDDENEEQPPAPDVPNYSTLVVKDIQNIPADFTFDRVEVKVTGVDWQVIETLSFPYENGQIVMTLPTSFSSEKLQTVDQRNGMGGYWTGTSDDADALVATLGDFFVFNGDKRVGRIAISNWSGKGSSAGKATLVSYQYADRSFTLTGSDKSYYYSNCSFYKFSFLRLLLSLLINSLLKYLKPVFQNSYDNIPKSDYRNPSVSQIHLLLEVLISLQQAQHPNLRYISNQHNQLL